MNIYVSHARSFDYQTELYLPLKSSLGSHHVLFLPHDRNTTHLNSKDIIRHTDIMFAEVSFPATGQGIEIGWADAFNIPIICFYRSTTTPARSLEFITRTFITYDTSTDMVTKLELVLKKAGNKFSTQQ